MSRIWIAGFVALALSPTRARGAEPAEARRILPVDGDPSLDLAAGARPTVGVPRTTPPITSDVRPQRLGDKILFVNFDGATMASCGNNNPQQNCTTIFPGGTVLPFSGTDAQRAAIIQVARKRLAEFGISVTDTRPASGDYDMEMVGNWQGSDPDFAGIAPAGDCWDNGGGETSFTLEISTSPDQVAEVMLQELAHTWGLDHVDEQQDLLYPTTQGTNKTFRDECYQIVANTELDPTQGFCDHHQQACGDYSHQNSHAELLLIFGPSTPDTIAPTVEITAPIEGATVTGGDVDLVVQIQDDQRPAVMKLIITLTGDAIADKPPEDGAFAAPAELKFPIKDLPNGSYTLRIEGTDESDNAASDEITFTVEGSDVIPSGGDADSSGGGSDDAPGDGSSDGGDGTAGGTTSTVPGFDTEPRGCACASDPINALASGGPLTVLLLGLRRRRRR